MGDQRARRDPSLLDELQEGLHVPPLGPANIGKWVVVPAFLVSGIVAARSVGHGQPEIQLLAVVLIALEVHSDHADEDDAALGPRDDRRGIDRLVALGRRRDDDRVRSPALGERLGRLDESRVAGGIGAKRAREVAFRWDRVEAQHLAPVGLEQLHRQLTEEAEAHDHHALAQRGLGLAHALKGDRADRDERRALVVDSLGNRNAEILGNIIVLGVARISRSGAGDPVADLEALHAVSEFDDGSGAAVAEGDGVIELRPHRLDGADDPLALRLVHHLAHQVRARHGLARQARLRKIRQHFFRARADQGRARGDNHASRSRRRGREILEREFAGPIVLRDLFHGAQSSGVKPKGNHPRDFVPSLGKIWLRILR